MHTRPLAIAFDVVETLFSLEPVRARLVELGLPPGAMEAWFASFLRDALALDAAGTYEPFQNVAKGALEVFLASHDVAPSKAHVDRVLDAFAELPAHPDVRPAFERAHGGGVRVATLTNGSARSTKKLLERAGLVELVDETISIDDVKRWKPVRAVYLHAARVLDVPPGKLALVAAHGWDVHGAKEAGLTAGFVARGERRMSTVMSTPDVTGGSLVEVIERLVP